MNFRNRDGSAMIPPHQASRPAAVHREDDPLGVRIHGAAGTKLERPEVFWARKAEEEKRLRRPITPRSEAQCIGPVQVEIERRGDNRIAARRVTIAGQTDERTFEYDEANRLTRVREGRNPLERYEYDRLGRRTVESNVLRGLAGRSFRYDLSDRLLSAGEARYEHDAHGFRCQKEINGWTTRYFYTPEGLLRRVELPDGRAVEYACDRQGRRIAKAVHGRVVERFAWKGNRLVGWSDGQAATFHYADGRVPLFLVRDGEKYRLCCDQIGTVFAVLDAKNRLVKRIESDAFGNVVADSNPQLRLPFGFAGGLADADTGLLRFGARDYDPDTGRWTAKDPLGLTGGDRDLYRYCLADPVNLVDPSGLLFEFWTNPEVPEEEGSGQAEEETDDTFENVVDDTADSSWASGADAEGEVRQPVSDELRYPVAPTFPGMVEMELPGVGKTIMNPDAAGRVQEMDKRLQEQGINLQYKSAYRDREEQTNLDSKVKAAPGTSSHELGGAVDVSKWGGMSKEKRETITQTAKDVGLRNGASFNDPNHFYWEMPGGVTARPEFIRKTEDWLRKTGRR